MSDPGPADSGSLPTSLWVAIALSLASLGLRWTSTTRGYQLEVRVLLVGAVASLGAAAVWWLAHPDRAKLVLTGAIVLLTGALALRLRGIHPAALIAVCGAISATVLSRRRLLARSVAAARQQ